jgi:segregation and condensation protein A
VIRAAPMSDVEPLTKGRPRAAEGGRATPVEPLRGGAGRSGAGGDGAPVPESGARVCEVSLEEFEGPLDLLLHLVRRHELDILDIPIAFVCEKYLEYIEFMHALDLEVAGDYLVMAATLAYLKSRELVPQDQLVADEGGDEDGGADPREQLIRRLLEYQKYKDAAERLDGRPIAGRDTFGRGAVVELPPVDAGLAPITLFRLAEAYQRVLDRARIHKSHDVVLETVSVAARMEQLTALLIERSRFEFEALFLERSWGSESELRSMLVITLMSVLELVRMGVASVHQPLGADTIVVERVASAEEAREALRGYDEALSFGDGREAGSEGEAPPDDDEGEAPVDEGLGALELEEDAHGLEGARVTGPASPGVEAFEAATPSVAAEGPVPADAGAFARSVVSESPSSEAVVDGAGEVAPAPLADGGASESTEGDGHEHGENGEAEAIEGS